MTLVGQCTPHQNIENLNRSERILMGKDLRVIGVMHVLYANETNECRNANNHVIKLKIY